jgi:hypothetical protein
MGVLWDKAGVDGFGSGGGKRWPRDGLIRLGVPVVVLLQVLDHVRSCDGIP